MVNGCSPAVQNVPNLDLVYIGFTQYKKRNLLQNPEKKKHANVDSYFSMDFTADFTLYITILWLFTMAYRWVEIPSMGPFSNKWFSVKS